MNIEAEIRELQEQIDKLKEKQEELRNTPWNPEGGEFYIDHEGDVNCSETYRRYCYYGTDFETREGAEKAAQYYAFYHRLYKLAEDCNTRYTKKTFYSVYYLKGEWGYSNHEIEHIDRLFTSLESAQRAINIMNRDGWRLPEVT